MRNEHDDFYICNTLQDICHGDELVKIRWLTEIPDRKGVYAPDYCGKIRFECILTSVTLKKIAKSKYRLSKIEQERVRKILDQAIKFCRNNQFRTIGEFNGRHRRTTGFS